MMALEFLKMVVSVLFAMSFFHRLYRRTVSTFLILAFAFTWVVLDSFKLGSYGLWVVSCGLIYVYWRGMHKPPVDKIS